MKTSFLILTLTTSLSLASGLSHASQPVVSARLDAPYKVSTEVRHAVQSTNTWAEVYRVPMGARKESLIKIKQGSVPPAVGVSVAGALHVNVDQHPLVLEEADIHMTRQERSIEYDEQCNTTPKPGDKLLAHYQSVDGVTTGTMSLTLVEHIAYAETSSSDTLVERLTEVTPQNCAKISSSRTLYQGTLTLERPGQPQIVEPVLVQSIFE